MNNMQKSFKKKSALRCMADGGIFKNIVNGVQTFTDAKNATPGAAPYTPTAQRELSNTGITPGATPPMPAPAKLSVKTPVAPPPPGPSPAAPAVPVAPQQFQPQSPYEKMTGKPQIPIGPRSNLMMATGGFGPTPMPRAIGSMRQDIGSMRQDIGANRPEIGALGMPLMTSVGYAAGGHVKGPGGPTDDEVGPVMLSDGEYVLPADTVRKVGKENLDALKDATHTPVKARRGSPLRKMANGTMTEQEKRIGALGLPITTSVDYVEPVQPTPTVGALGLPITTSVGPEPMPRERTGALGLPITTSAGYGKPSALRAPESAEGWQGKPRATPQAPAVPAAADPAPAMGTVERLTGWAPGTAEPAPAAPAAPAATTMPKTPGEAQRENFNATGGAAAGASATPAEAAPPSEYTPFQQAELDKLKVGGAYLDAPIDVQRSPLRNDPYQPAAIPSGATQINSKFYRDANGAVIEGKAPGPTTPAPLAGPTSDLAPVDADLPLAQGPRAYRSDTIHEGTAPGEFANLGNRIFGTSGGLNKDGRMDTFVGVGSGFNERSAEFGPDPGGLDRARQDAAVEKMFPTKPRTPRSFQPKFQSNARQINEQYDKMEKGLRQMFSSPRAQGNLAKALERATAARMQALGQDSENITRQQSAAMQAQQQGQQLDLSARELASREQQAARADETDRLAITSQDQRAAATAAQNAASDALKQETTEWKTMVNKGQFYGDLADWRAYKISGSNGKSYRPNSKEIKANEQRVTTLADKMFADDPAKATAVKANASLLYGSPESSVAGDGNAIADLVAITGRTKLGVPVQAEDGAYTYKVSMDDLQKGTFGISNTLKTLLYGWSGEAYKFVDASGEEYYVPKIRAYPETDRFIEGYFKARKEADKGSK